MPGNSLPRRLDAANSQTLVGPAGTGKSFVVGALAKAWQDPASWGAAGDRSAGVGLATSQVATDVLAGRSVVEHLAGCV